MRGTTIAVRARKLTCAAIAIGITAACVLAAQATRPFDAYASELQASAVTAAPTSPGADGSYLLTSELQGRCASCHDSLFDSNVRLNRESGSMTVDVLVPDAQVAEHISDMAIETDDGYMQAKRSDTEEGVLFSGMPVSDVGDVQKLAIGVEGVDDYHEGSTKGDLSTYLNADWGFTGMVTWWPGFAAQAPAGLPDGVYAMDIEAKTGGNVDYATNTISFTDPMMGGEVFGDTLWLVVKNGKYAASVDMHEVSNSFVRNIRVYTRAGNYTLDSDPDSALVNVKTLSYQRNEDASLFSDEDAQRYSDIVSFNLADPGKTYASYVRFLITSRAPVASSLEKTPFVIMMKWDALRPVEVPDTSAIEEKVASARALKESDFRPDGWTAFKNRRDAASEAVRAAHALSQEQVDVAAQALDAARSALVAKTAGDRLNDAISVLPVVSALTLADKGAVDAAYAAYLALSKAERSLVDASTLNAARLRIAKLEKAAIAKATPGKVTLTKKTKSTKKGKVTVAWKKVANAAGYQVKVGKKAYTVKGAAKLKKTVKAKKGKKVKVQVRAFSTYNGKTLYGPWSAAKKVKVKK